MPVRTVHSGWLDLHLVTLTAPDGSTYERYVEDHGRAVAVLPYNPETRKALLVSLPRAAMLYAGGTAVLEAPAGIIEPGENAADCARRELVEEAGLEVETLEPAGATWMSPGTTTEQVTLFLAPYADRQRTGLGGGVEHENEHIVVHEVPLGDLAAVIDGEVPTDAKTRILVETLRRRRPELF
ncbi:NUDIX hydrolase [Caulobacter mirabilis]|uniref:GDP-mannose pyrophosphatase n=2 Tax=Caulobacter mirabilis TaxID=69666 RepID=A0A2D2B445_9CAUL|nr:NUDIX hydrolase [Caulobacter mirabilis]